jgi:hypothetical protein
VRRSRLGLSLLAAAAGLSMVATAGQAAKPSAVPVFTNYEAPAGLGDRAGEPTLGINPKTGAVLFQAYTETLRVTDMKPGGKATWELGKFPTPQPRSFDPILRTDEDTGRTFTSQLLLACSQGGSPTTTPRASRCRRAAASARRSTTRPSASARTSRAARSPR